MHGTIPQPYEEQRKIERRLRRGDDKIVAAPKWVKHAKEIWPFKTDMHIAEIAKVDPRTVQRWMAGEGRPTIEVKLAMDQAIWGSSE